MDQSGKIYGRVKREKERKKHHYDHNHNQSIAFLFRFRSAYAEMATGTHLQNWLKKEFQIGFEEEEKVE